MKYIILVSITFFISYGEWFSIVNYLTSNTKFSYSTKSDGYLYSGGFIVPGTYYQTAYFMNCTSPVTSYITINTTFPQTAYYYTISTNYTKYFVSFDLFFHGTWNGETVQYVYGTASNSQSHTTTQSNQFNEGFCDSITAELKTINFTFGGPVNGKHQFTLISTNFMQVSIRNVLLSGMRCYPSCYTCYNENIDQCITCYYGTPINGICPICPSTQPYYVKHTGCREICQFYSQRYSHGFCQPFSNHIYLQTAFSFTSFTEFYKWQIIYDPDHVDTSPKILSNSQFYFYGIFQYKSGLSRLISELTTASYALPVALKIDIMMCQPIPIGSGIIIKFNNTYYGSIYQDDFGTQFDKIQYYHSFGVNSYSTFVNCKYYETYLYVDIPQYPFFFSISGNFTDPSFGWGLKSLDVTSGYCPSQCALCNVKFKCEQCITNYYLTKNNTCSLCKGAYQTLTNSICIDYDKETQYSEYLIQEHTNLIIDPNQFSQYVLEQSTGINFLKGQDIYFSLWNGFRVFGGPFIWAQAKFTRVHQILQPHHSVTIGFYIIYGPLFPQTSKFIYTIESNLPVENLNSNFSKNYTDSSKELRIYEKVIHNSNTLTISWECQGTNEPINAYCGFYNYYVAVHYCQPYCLSCVDENNCTTWDITFNSNITKFSASDCQTNQYFDQENYMCIDLVCPLYCQTCSSPLDCQICIPSLTITKNGCGCQKNEYLDQSQCLSCPIECTQCTKADSCLECILNNNRILKNNQCVCQDGYYSSVIPICDPCDEFCQTCNGPTQNNCLTCSLIANIQLYGNTCSCPSNTYYEKTINSCLACDVTCLTCYFNTPESCLSCDPLAYRILKGLVCDCQPGYYFNSSECIACPTIEDNALTQCYKSCSSNILIWHTQNCNSCASGFQMIMGDCQPICGDNLIVGYEDCEDGNDIMEDGCFNCKFQCPKNCVACDQNTILPCSDICGDLLVTGIEDCDDGNLIQYDGCYNCKFQCQNECTSCIKGQCYECLTKGWFLDPTQTPWQCKERCGDGWKVGTEQCDDANTYDTDGCKDCKYYCRIGCSSCNYTTNKCLICEQTGTIPKDYYCINVCGDGLIIKDPYGFFEEQCDDGNITNYDGCSSTCKFQCQGSSICILCDINNKCQQCAAGYTLNLSQNKCEPICGDGILVELENCEHSLQLPYQGCQNCKPKCQLSCLTCNTLGMGCEVCKVGYVLIDNLCYSICGDQIITQDEDCDDGNLIFDDGCHLCKFNCQNVCNNCINGKCYDCLDGYELHRTFCIPICDSIPYQNFSNDLKCTQQNQKCVNNCKVCNFGICEICEDNYNFNYNSQCTQNTNLIYKSFEFVENILMNLDCNHNRQQQYQYLSNQNQLETELTFYYFQKQNFMCWEEKQIQISEENFGFISQKQENILKKCQLFLNFEQKRLQNSCLNCIQGYDYDSLTDQCHPICGDKLTVEEEDCDDDNLLPYDGCYQCKYSCSLNCLECQKGVCYQCEDEFLLFDNVCKKINLYRFDPSNLRYVSNQSIETSQNQQQLIEIYIQQFESINFQELTKIQYSFTLQAEETIGYEKQNDCFDENFEEFHHQCQNALLDIGYCKLIFEQNLSFCSNSIKIFNSNLFLEIFQTKIEIYKQEQCQTHQIFDEDFGCQSFDDSLDILEVCDPYCSICISGQCTLCDVGWALDSFSNCQPICGDLILNGQEECDDGNVDPHDGCFSCRQQCSNNCKICIQGICQECNLNYELNHQFNICQEIQSQQNIITNYPNEQNKQQVFDQVEKGHYFLTTQGDVYIKLQEESKCENQLFFDNFPLSYLCKQNLKQLSMINNCPNNCLDCVDGNCTICNQGYYVDIISNTCNSLCGDILVAGQEEVCDDGNEEKYDGCYQCQFQCQIECLNCQFGECLECQSPLIFVEEKWNCQVEKSCIDQVGLYYDDFSNSCVSECGDGIVSGYEQCDDGNDIKFDGCYNCNYSCVEFCFDCLKGICQKCQNGYTLENMNCVSVCGDGILIGTEECDDGNDIIRDGCSMCKIDIGFKCQNQICYQCQEKCSNCELMENNVKCLNCDKGYFLKDNFCNKCSEKCEECENTPNNCTVCVMKDCQTCNQNSGFYYDAPSKSCISKCGDGIITENEQCDDNNLIDQDGCNSKCQKEEGFECQGNICQIKPEKLIEYQYANSTSTNQIQIVISDSNQIQICQNLEVWIEYFNKSEFNFTSIFSDVSQNCQLEFQFYKTILEQNLIHVVVKYEENRLLTEKTQEIIIIPRKVVYYSQTQQQQAQAVAQQTSNLTFLLQLIGPLTILLGGVNIFWSILDILTWINNFYFLNVDFPINVKLLFNSLQWSDIFNIPEILTLNQPGDPYYFEAPVKFTEKEVNPMFLNNIQLFCALVGIAFIFYLIFDLILRIDIFFTSKTSVKRNLFQIFSVNPNASEQVSPTKKTIENCDQNFQIKESKIRRCKAIQILVLEAKSYKKNIKAIFFKIVDLVFLDICLACCLQLLFTPQSEYLIVHLNYLLAIVSLCFIIYIFRTYDIVCQQHELLLKSQVYESQFGPLYEGINISSPLAKKFCLINLLRKALFIFCTVFFYHNPLIQTCTCCLICFLNMAVICYGNPFEAKEDLWRISVPDFCIFCIIFITVLLAWHDVSNIFSFEQKYYIGWLILFFLGLSILVQLVFLIKEFLINLKERGKALKQLLC